MKKSIMMGLMLLSTSVMAQVIIDKRVDFVEKPSADVIVSADRQGLNIDTEKVGTGKGFKANVRSSGNGDMNMIARDKRTGKVISKMEGREGQYAKGYADTEAFYQKIDLKEKNGDVVGNIQFSNKVTGEHFDLKTFDENNRTLAQTKGGYKMDISVRANGAMTVKVTDIRTKQVICYADEKGNNSYLYDAQGKVIAKGLVNDDPEDYTVYNKQAVAACEKALAVFEEDEEDENYEDYDEGSDLDNFKEFLGFFM